MSAIEHPFAQYVRILGKGKKGSRSLSREEAKDAMSLILDDQVRPEQLGAFLMLLRVKEESPEELQGFVEAVNERSAVPEDLKVDLDWSTYAGKKNHLPWYFLSALCLAGAGTKVVMHGARGHTAGRVYIEDMLHMFGFKSCHNWLDAELELQQCNLAYVPIDMLSPVLAEIIELRNILGLRSPVHTLCRLLNPLNAPYRIDGVFHPAYGPMHQQTAKLLGQNNSVTVKGDGGEAEIKPDTDCTLQWVKDGEYIDEVWPRLVPKRMVKEAELNPRDLLSVWRGELDHEYGAIAITETIALCLKLMGKTSTVEESRSQASELWANRDKVAY